MRMLAAVVVGILVVGARAADKPEVAELKKQLAEAEMKVAELRGKLLAVQGESTYIAPGVMKVGQAGRLINPNDQRRTAISIHKIVTVIDEDTCLLQADADDARLPLLIVKGFSTKGIADGHMFNSDGRVWKAVGTEKYLGRTYMVIRPETEAVKPKR
jgi:hypothetical protein